MGRAGRGAAEVKHPEAAIQRAFFQAIRLHGGPGVVAFSVPNERRNKGETLRLMAQGLTPGAPDVIVAWAGGAAAIEFKAPAGRLTEAQKRMGERLAACGWHHIVARSWAEAWQALDAVGAPLERVLAPGNVLRLERRAA